MVVRMVVTVLMVMVVMVSFGGGVVKAHEPKDCKIYTLNGTAFGESWTRSVPIKTTVTLALKNPNPEPWGEFYVEFESNTGASVGTLKVARTSSSLKLNLTNWATTVHKSKERTQTLGAHGSLKQIHGLHNWVYVNVSVAEKVLVAVNRSYVLFGKVDAKPFVSLYVRVPDGQDLLVGFNCNSAGPKKAAVVAEGEPTFSPEAPENSGMMVTIVASILVLLFVGVFVFWFLGRKKRNALVEKFKEDAEICQDCGGSIHDDDDDVYDADDDRDKETPLTKGKEVDICEDCGDVMTDEDHYDDDEEKLRDPEKVQTIEQKEEQD